MTEPNPPLSPEEPQGEALPNRIRAIREERNALIPGQFSQAAVARTVGVDPNTMRAWELGQMVPRQRKQVALARALGVKVSDLGLPPSPVPKSRRSQVRRRSRPPSE